MREEPEAKTRRRSDASVCDASPGRVQESSATNLARSKTLRAVERSRIVREAELGEHRALGGAHLPPRARRSVVVTAEVEAAVHDVERELALDRQLACVCFLERARDGNVELPHRTAARAAQVEADHVRRARVAEPLAEIGRASCRE